MNFENWKKEVENVREQLDRLFDVKDGKMPTQHAYSYALTSDMLEFIFNLDIDELQEKYNLVIKKGFVEHLFLAIDDSIQCEDIDGFNWDEYNRIFNIWDFKDYKGK